MNLPFFSTIVALVIISIQPYLLYAAGGMDEGQEDISETAAKISQALTASYKPTEGKIVLVKDSKEVYINLGSENGVKTGDEFEIVLDTREIRDPDSGEILGIENDMVGRIRIMSVQASKLSVGKIISQIKDVNMEPGIQVLRSQQGKIKVAILLSGDEYIPQEFFDELHRHMMSAIAFEMRTESIVVSAGQSVQDIGKALNVDAVVKVELETSGNVTWLGARLVECSSGNILANTKMPLNTTVKPAVPTQDLQVANKIENIYDRAEALAAIADKYVQSGRKDRAYEVLTDAVKAMLKERKKTETQIQALRNRAIQLSISDPNEAQYLFRRIMDLAPKGSSLEAEAKNHYAFSIWWMEDQVARKQVLSKAIELFKDVAYNYEPSEITPLALRNLVVISKMARDRNTHQKAWKQMVEQYPTHPQMEDLRKYRHYRF